MEYMKVQNAQNSKTINIIDRESTHFEVLDGSNKLPVKSVSIEHLSSQYFNTKNNIFNNLFHRRWKFLKQLQEHAEDQQIWTTLLSKKALVNAQVKQMK